MICEKYSPRGLGITTDEFQQLIDHYYSPTLMGYGVYEDVYCPMCGHIWVAVAIVGGVGKECPKCLYYEKDFKWLPESTGISHDGCWLVPVGNKFSLFDGGLGE